jgi:hypothetical protein
MDGHRTDWQAVPMPDSPRQLGDAVAELRALMKRLHQNSGLSYDAQHVTHVT